MDVLADILTATKTGGVLTSSVHAAAPWGFQLDQVPFAAFHVVTEGSCWLRCPGAAPVALAAGDLALLPRGGGHAVASHERGPLVNYDEVLRSLGATTPGAFVTLPGPGPTTRLICGAYPYDQSVAHPLLAALPPLLLLRANQRPSAIGATIELLLTELDSAEPGARTIIDRLVDILFVHIVRAWLATQSDEPTAWLAALRDPAIAMAISRLHSQPTRAWTVADLAAEVRLSRASLARRFRHLVGQSPLAYLTQWRMELAARRLRDTEEPIAVIAHSVGYRSEAAFTRAFQRAKQAAPSRYRAHHRINIQPTFRSSQTWSNSSMATSGG